jgi:hypothetical protein
MMWWIQLVTIGFMVGGAAAIVVEMVSRRRLYRKRPTGARAVSALSGPAEDSAQRPSSRGLASRASRLSSGGKVLLGLAIVVVGYGLFALWYYWNDIAVQADKAFGIAGLFIAMVVGMVVRVVSAAYDGKGSFKRITPAQLLYPMLFSPIVFFPAWGLMTGGDVDVFAFYTAFLNGYFWESVVSTVKAPAADDGG